MRRPPRRLAALLATCVLGTNAWADDTGDGPQTPPPASAPATGAATPARVDFERPSCEPAAFDVPSFIAVLRIELATDGVGEVAVRDPGSAPTRAATRDALAILSLDDACSDGPLSIAIDDAATDKRVARTVELGDVPVAARARVLALAAAELLRASWAELLLPAAPAPRATVPAQVREAAGARLRRAARHVERPARAPTPSEASPDRVLLLAAPEARFFFREHLGLLGARIGPSIPIGRRTHLRLRAHVGSAYGAGAAADDRFDAWLVTSGVGLMAGRQARSAALEFGPHLELGWGWRRLRRPGDGDASAPTDGAIASVSVVASGRVHLGGAWWSVADVEVGQAVASEDGGVARTGGTTAGARLGFALSP